MSRRVKRNLPLLKLLVQASPQHRRAILNTASNDLVAAIVEIALNALKGNIPLSQHQIKVLKGKRHAIKSLYDKRLPIKRKKEAIGETVGWIYQAPVKFCITIDNGAFDKPLMISMKVRSRFVLYNNPCMLWGLRSL